MAKLKDWILEEAEGEKILGVVLGSIDEWSRERLSYIPGDYPEKRLLTWEQALPWIEYEFSNGFGSEGCFSICAWTENKVIAISCYDGSTSPFSLPRNPCDCDPIMPGGG